MHKLVKCTVAQPGCTFPVYGDIYSVRGETGLLNEYWRIHDGSAILRTARKTLFTEVIEMKTPPIGCACKRVATPTPEPTQTSRNIVTRQLRAISDSMAREAATKEEIVLVLETCLLIMKGK